LYKKAGIFDERVVVSLPIVELSRQIFDTRESLNRTFNGMRLRLYFTHITADFDG